MGCNCKGNKNLSPSGEPIKISLKQNVFAYFFKFLAFILFIISLPIVNIVILYYVFKTLVLNKDFDIKPLLMFLINKANNNENDEEDDLDDLSELNPEDFELVGVDNITTKLN